MNLGERVIGWAKDDPAVALLVLIGSRARPAGARTAADRFSDWDFQIAVEQPQDFATGVWLESLGLKPLAYVLRPGRLGSSLKASAVTAEGELDLVVLPARPLRGLAQLVESGGLVTDPMAVQAMGDLAAVLAGGLCLLKGEGEFGRLYAHVMRAVPLPRLDDSAVVRLAEAFVCDYVFTRRKIDRGELLAARRWLHHQLAESNFRLLHESRLRAGLESFPDARRLEFLGEPRCEALALGLSQSAGDLRMAVERAANLNRELVAALIGESWRWPDLSSLRLGAE